ESLVDPADASQEVPARRRARRVWAGMLTWARGSVRAVRDSSERLERLSIWSRSGSAARAAAKFSAIYFADGVNSAGAGATCRARRCPRIRAGAAQLALRATDLPTSHSCGSRSSADIRLQFGLEQLLRVMQPRTHRAHRTIHDLGNLVVAQIVDFEKRYHGAM